MLSDFSVLREGRQAALVEYFFAEDCRTKHSLRYIYGQTTTEMVSIKVQVYPVELLITWFPLAFQLRTFIHVSSNVCIFRSLVRSLIGRHHRGFNSRGLFILYWVFGVSDCTLCKERITSLRDKKRVPFYGPISPAIRSSDQISFFECPRNCFVFGTVGYLIQCFHFLLLHYTYLYMKISKCYRLVYGYLPFLLIRKIRKSKHFTAISLYFISVLICSVERFKPKNWTVQPSKSLMNRNHKFLQNELSKRYMYIGSPISLIIGKHVFTEFQKIGWTAALKNIFQPSNRWRRTVKTFRENITYPYMGMATLFRLYR